MINFIKGMVVIFAMATSSVAVCLEEFRPYFGTDIKWQITEAKKQWQPLLPKDYWGGTLYLGAKFFEMLSLELGYSQTIERHKSHTFKENETFFNDEAVVGVKTYVKNHFTNWHMDINGYFPLCDCWEFIGSIGMGVVSPRYGITVVDTATDVFSTKVPLKGISRGVFRLGAGVQYMATEHIGLRTMARFESTSDMRVGGEVTQGIDTQSLYRPFKNSYSVAAGVFWKFGWEP